MLQIQCTFGAKEFLIIRIISDKCKCQNVNVDIFIVSIQITLIFSISFFKVVVDILQTSVCTTFKTTSQERKVIII